MNCSFTEIKDIILGAKNIALFAHQRPDGDAIGSVLGMYHLICDNHTKQVVPHILDSIPDDFSFLPESHHIVGEYKDIGFDLMIILDTATLARSGLSESDLHGKKTLIIDHHQTNAPYSEHYHINPSSTSVTHILSDFVRHIGWEISPAAATCLMTGLYTDSGSFIHRNTTASSFEIAAYLASKGADPGQIAQHVFKSKSFEFQKNFGLLMGRMKMFGDTIFCSMYGYEESSGKELKSALISSMNSIKGVRYACVLTQDDTHIRGSLRTNLDSIDVAQMASIYDGGGHKKASGFDFPGRLLRDGDVDSIQIDGQIFTIDNLLQSFDTMTPLT